MSESTLSSSPTAPAETARPARAIDYGSARRRSPATDRLLEFLKTLAWVAPLTILIWVYAEREQSNTQSNISIPIEIRTPDATRIVTLKEPADQNITATLTGPRTVLEQFIRDLQGGGPGHPAVQILLDSKLEKGVYPFDAAKVISETALFKRQGISIKDVLPHTLKVEIDDYETRLLPVRASQNLPSLPEISFVPDKVEVRAPSRLFRETDVLSRLYVIADTSKLAGLTTPGRQVIPGLPVQVAFKGDHVSTAQSTVNASVDVAKADAETTLGSVPVWPFAPPTVLEKYKIDYKTRTVPNVQLKGSPKEIDSVKSGEFRVVAALDVTQDDTDPPKTSHKRKLRFTLPPGVSVVSTDPDQYTIDFTLIERSPE